MENKDRISYIIVTWNNESIIKECIDSLIEYSNYDNEIIVVDNNSSDNTCKVIKENYQEKVILIESDDNLGFSKANNEGLKVATGDYVFYVNPDVVFIEDIVTPMIEVLKNDKTVGVVSPMLLYRDLSYQVSTCNFPSASKVLWDDLHLYKLLPKSKQRKYAQAQYKGNENRFVDWTYGAAHLCRSDETKKLGGYPEGYFMYGEDTEFCMSFLDKLNLKTYYLATSKLIHIGGYSEKQVINSKKVVYGTKAAMYFVKKYYGAWRLFWYKYMLFNTALFKDLFYMIKGLFKKTQEINNKRKKWNVTWRTVISYKGEQN